MVRKEVEVATCRLPFKVFKGKPSNTRCILRLKNKFNQEIVYLDNKKQETKYGLFISTVKCNKQGRSIAFRGRKLPGKVHITNLELLQRSKRLNVI